MFFTEDDKQRMDNFGKDISDLFRFHNSLAQRVYKLEQKQASLMLDIQDLRSTVDNNANAGNELVTHYNELAQRIATITKAIDLLAAGMGKEITIQPEVPATITMTPGEPEKLVLVKAPKVRQEKPKPITIPVTSALLGAQHVQKSR